MTRPQETPAFPGMFDGFLEVSPPLSEAQIGAIPAKRGVFLLAAAGDQPILLTTAASLRGRLRGRLEEIDPTQTSRSADLRAITRRVYWKLAPSHFEMDWTYLEIARAIYPKRFAKLLSWRPAWFVHVDPSDRWPHFLRSREVFASPGRYFGPFESGRSAEKFIEIVQDAFDLCRDVQCLRRSPREQRCSYGQMGRCLCPCDGSVSMAAYRREVFRAAQFAAGRRGPHVEGLQRRMREAAAALEFEVAAALKTRMSRLAELDSPACRHVAPAEEFRFVMIQRSGSRRRVNVFLVDRGAIARARSLDWPLACEKVRRRLGRMTRFVAAGPRRPADAADRWRIGLVARTLFSGDRRQGLVLRWREDMSAEEVADAVADAADALAMGGADRKRTAPPAAEQAGDSAGGDAGPGDAGGDAP